MSEALTERIISLERNNQAAARNDRILERYDKKYQIMILIN